MRYASASIGSAVLALVLTMSTYAQTLDITLADARLDALLEQGGREDLEKATAVYLDILRRAGTSMTPDEEEVLDRHIAQLALILPAEVQDLVADGDLQDYATLKDGAGEVLITWWRSQDPLPASPQNERLAEHLQRVAVAETQFAHDDRTTGFDDRGDIYVRYGRPTRESVIRFDDPRLIDEVYQPGVAVSASDFPDNAFWLYRHIDRAGYFLFVKKGSRYLLGTTEDLLPSVLRFGYAPSGRGKRKSDMVLAVMRSVYRQLALEHPDFSLRFNDVDLYANDLEQNDPGRGRLGTRNVTDNNRAIVGVQGTGRSGDNGTGNTLQAIPQTNALQLHEFVQQMLYTGKMEDAQAIYRRETSMPEQYTEIFRETEVLPLAVRTARFLADDGTTRTEIYWSPEPGGLRFTEKKRRNGDPVVDVWSHDQFLVHLTAIQQTSDYQDRKTNRKPYLITDLPNVADVAIPTQTMAVEGDTGMYNLALQWDQHQARTDGGNLQVGPHVKVASHRIDSLRALNADPGVLEISDLKPIFVDDLDVLYADDGASGVPYPHQQIWPALPLGLYFEVYHLTFGDDDQAHYTIAYEIAGREQGGLLKFLGQGDQERTTAETPYTGQSRTAREFIVLDLSEWEGEGALEVRLTVTDDTSGQQVSRSLLFDLVVN